MAEPFSWTITRHEDIPNLRVVGVDIFSTSMQQLQTALQEPVLGRSKWRFAANSICAPRAG